MSTFGVSSLHFGPNCGDTLRLHEVSTKVPDLSSLCNHPILTLGLLEDILFSSTTNFLRADFVKEYFTYFGLFGLFGLLPTGLGRKTDPR